MDEKKQAADGQLTPKPGFVEEIQTDPLTPKPVEIPTEGMPPKPGFGIEVGEDD